MISAGLALNGSARPSVFIAAILAIGLSCPAFAATNSSSLACPAFQGPGAVLVPTLVFEAQARAFRRMFDGAAGMKGFFSGQEAIEQAPLNLTSAMHARQRDNAATLAVRAYLGADGRVRALIEDMDWQFIGSFALPPVVGEPPARTHLGVAGILAAPQGVDRMGVEVIRTYAEGSPIQSRDYLISMIVFGGKAWPAMVLSHVLTAAGDHVGAAIARPLSPFARREARIFRTSRAGQNSFADLELPDEENGSIIAMEFGGEDARALSVITTRGSLLSYVLLDGLQGSDPRQGPREMRLIRSGRRDMTPEEFQPYVASGIYRLVDRSRR